MGGAVPLPEPVAGLRKVRVAARATVSCDTSRVLPSCQGFLPSSVGVAGAALPGHRFIARPHRDVPPGNCN